MYYRSAGTLILQSRCNKNDPAEHPWIGQAKPLNPHDPSNEHGAPRKGNSCSKYFQENVCALFSHETQPHRHFTLYCLR